MMPINTFLLVVLLFISNVGFGQIQIKQDSLSSTKVVGFQQSVSYDTIEIRFKSVIADSRCPKNVTCIRAGEAKVILSVYENNQLIKDQTVIFDATGIIDQELNTLFSSEDFKILALNLKPYPIVVPEKQISHKNYEVELLIRRLQI